jgi:hypothetical protein
MRSISSSSAFSTESLLISAIGAVFLEDATRIGKNNRKKSFRLDRVLLEPPDKAASPSLRRGGAKQPHRRRAGLCRILSAQNPVYYHGLLLPWLAEMAGPLI